MNSKLRNIWNRVIVLLGTICIIFALNGTVLIFTGVLEQTINRYGIPVSVGVTAFFIGIAFHKSITILWSLHNED